MRKSRIRRKNQWAAQVLTGCGLRTHDFTETEKWCAKCSYSERNDINTQHLFSVSLKTTKKERKKIIIIKSTSTRSRLRFFTWLPLTAMLGKKCGQMWIAIYWTADNSAGSSLYKDCLLVNLYFTEQLYTVSEYIWHSWIFLRRSIVPFLKLRGHTLFIRRQIESRRLFWGKVFMTCFAPGLFAGYTQHR